MNKRYKSNQFKKVPYLLALVIVLLSVGYSAFGTDMNLSNIVAKIRLKKDVRISSVIVTSSEVDASSSYQEYNANKLIAGITLPEITSTITFGVGIVNLGNVEAGILKINNMPDNLDYEFIDYNLKDKICDKEDSTKCSLGANSEIKLKIKYKDSTSYDSSNTSFSLDLELDIEPFYTVNYTNITTNGYPTEVLGGNSLSVDFGDTEFNYLKVLIDDVVTYNYDFEDGVLTISEITGNVEIIDEAPIYLTNLKIDGNSVQEGKNLLKPFVKGTGLNFTTGAQTTNSNYSTTDYIPVDFNENNNYYLSGLVNTLHSCVFAYNQDKQFLGRIAGSQRQVVSLNATSFTSGTAQGTGDIAYLRVAQYFVSGTSTGTLEDLDTAQIQLEKGYAATTYEPYIEPTPDTPIEILSVGEKTKNLFNINDVKNSTASYTINNNMISILSDGNGTYRQVVYVKISVQPLTNYYLNFQYEVVGTGTGRISIYQYDENNTFIKDKSFYSSGTLETESNTKYIEVRVYANESTVIPAGEGVVYSNIQIEEGSVATEYEPYNKYKVPIEISSKNVYSGGDMNFTKSYSLSLSNPIKAGTYTISALFDNNSDIYDYGLLFYGTQTTIFGNLRYDKNQRTSKTVTFTEDITRLVFYATKSAATNEGVTASFTNIQIEEGTNATSYEPYMEPKTYNIFIDEPLRKVRDVSDYIDFATGQVVRNVAQYIFTGTESISDQSSNFPSDETYLFAANLTSQIDRTVIGGGWSGNYDLCNYFVNANRTLQTTTNNNDESFVGHGSVEYKGYIYFRPLQSRFTGETTNVSAFKTMITDWYNSGNPMILQYVIGTPSDETIEVPADIKFNGYSVVKVNTEIAPSNITWSVE